MIRDLIAQYLLPGAVVVLAALLFTLGVQTMRISGLKADVATVKKDYADYRLKATEAANAALLEREKERVALEKSKQENVDAAIAQASAAQRDAASARTAGEQLRRALSAARAARCQADPAPVVGSASAPASAPVDLFANVQLRLDEAADGIAQYADALRVSGELCVRQYDSVRKE